MLLLQEVIGGFQCSSTSLQNAAKCLKPMLFSHLARWPWTWSDSNIWWWSHDPWSCMMSVHLFKQMSGNSFEYFGTFEASIALRCTTFLVLFMALYLPDIYVITDSDYMSLDAEITMIFWMASFKLSLLIFDSSTEREELLIIISFWPASSIFAIFIYFLCDLEESTEALNENQPRSAWDSETNRTNPFCVHGWSRRGCPFDTHLPVFLYRLHHAGVIYDL